MSSLEMWSLIVGFFLPLAIASIMRKNWTEPLRATVAFIACVAAAMGIVWFSGQFDAKDISTSILLVVVTSIATFKGFWQKTGVTTTIESLTNPSSPGK